MVSRSSSVLSVEFLGSTLDQVTSSTSSRTNVLTDGQLTCSYQEIPEVFERLHAIENIVRYFTIYQEYCQSLLDKPNVLFVTYEKMVTDFDTWLDSIIEFLKLKVSPELVSKIKEEADFTVKEENIYAHKRQVLPGEHQRKLKPETIEILNYNIEYFPKGLADN